MNDMKTILILNLGLKSIRSIIFDSNGNKLSSASEPFETAINDEKVMQNPGEWWEKARKVIHASLKTIGFVHIDYISVVASSSCLCIIDSEGNELGDCIMVSDKRAIEYSDVFANSDIFRKVESRTGLSFDASLMLPKILWVKNNQPDIFNRAYKFLQPNDFLLGRLTGKYVADSLSALKYHYIAEDKKYPEELLNELGIEMSKLPDVVSIGTCIGTIRPDAAKYLFLNDDAQVVVTSYDAITSFFGSGVHEEGDAIDVSGTVTVFRVLTKRKSIKQSRKIFNIPLDEWNISIVGGSNNLGGGLIEWTKQCFYINEQYPYEVMEKEAGEVDTGAHGLVFLPYLLGERAPLWNSYARGVFFGLERTHTRKDMTRAVFESAGFVLRDLIAASEETGVSVGKVMLSGGLARNNLVSQIKADVTGKEIVVLNDFETTSIGSAMLAFIGAGIFENTLQASEAFVSQRMTIKPNLKNKKMYDTLYDFFKRLYETNYDLFMERNRLVDSIYTKKETVIKNL